MLEILPESRLSIFFSHNVGQFCVSYCEETKHELFKHPKPENVT